MAWITSCGHGHGGGGRGSHWQPVASDLQRPSAPIAGTVLTMARAGRLSLRTAARPLRVRPCACGRRRRRCLGCESPPAGSSTHWQRVVGHSRFHDEHVLNDRDSGTIANYVSSHNDGFAHFHILTSNEIPRVSVLR